MNKKRFCKLCGKYFPYTITIDGKQRNIASRKYCLDCSPWGSKNRIDLAKYGKKFSELPDKQERDKARRKRKYQHYYRKNPYYQKNKRNERKQKLVNILGGKCILCGYNNSIKALEFHHRNADEKLFNISNTGLLRQWDVILKEVLKCDLLCANCHREIHG